MLSQESDGTEFVDNSNVFRFRDEYCKDMVGTAQGENQLNMRITFMPLVKAGINGAWYNWFGLLV